MTEGDILRYSWKFQMIFKEFQGLQGLHDFQGPQGFSRSKIIGSFGVLGVLKGISRMSGGLLGFQDRFRDVLVVSEGFCDVLGGPRGFYGVSGAFNGISSAFQRFTVS